jgi:hypothetical protein
MAKEDVSKRTLVSGIPVAFLLGVVFNSFSGKVGTGGIDDIVTTIPLSDDSGRLADGSTIQIGSEQITVGTYDSDNNQLTGCTRGANATTAAAHSVGDGIVVLTGGIQIAEADFNTPESNDYPRFGFDNLGQNSDFIAFLPSNAEAGSGENTEIVLADNTKLSHPKNTKAYKLSDGTEITSVESDTNNTNLGKVKLIVTGGDVESATLTAFEKKIIDVPNQVFLIAVPRGWNANSENDTPDGWVYMTGKRSIDYTGVQNAGDITLEFNSYKLPGSESEHQTAFTGISWGALTTSGQKQNFTPPTLTNDDAAKLGKGEIVLKAAA